MNGLALCAGVDGLGLGLAIAIPGYRTVCAVEWEAAVIQIMVARQQERSLPPFAIWDCVTTFDGKPWRGIVEIVTAGFPCQPFSVAGKRAGTSDARWIWPDIARIIGEVEPELCFLENVPGLLLDPSCDIDRWEMEEQPDDALGGMGTVLRDLAELGFSAEWGCVRASDVGASHGRKRVFILAYRHLEHAKRPERWKGLIRSGCDSAGFDGGGEAAGKPLLEHPDSPRRARAVSEARPRRHTLNGAGTTLGESAGEGHPERGNGPGLRQQPAAERTGSELGDSESGRFGELREPSGSVGFADGAERQLDDAERGRLEGPDLHLRSARPDEAALSPGRSGDGISIFAPGPASPDWQDLLVQRPWLRPSLSQAEIELAFRLLADAVADRLVRENLNAVNKVRSCEALRRLWVAVVTQAYFGETRRLYRVHTAEVLQPWLHGQRADEGYCNSPSELPTPTSEDLSEICLPALRIIEKAPCPPCGRGSDQHCVVQPGNALRDLSSGAPSSNLEAQKTTTDLLCLQGEGELSRGAVLYLQNEIAEVWGSIGSAREWVAKGSAFNPFTVDRTMALRALGNGVVPLQVAVSFMALASRAGILTEDLWATN